MENKEYTFTEDELLDIFRDLTCIQDMMSLTNQQDGPVARRITSALRKLRIAETLKDGNSKDKMLDALRSVFWYEGLLTKSDSGDHGYSENCWLMKFIKDLEENTNTKYKNMYTTTDLETFTKTNVFDDDGFDYRERHTVIWQMLVEMFGTCGTSPRFGWIEDRKACAEFLKTIVNTQCVN